MFLLSTVTVRRAAALTVALSLGLGSSLTAAQTPLTRKRVAELVQAAPQTRVARSDAAVSAAIVTAAGILSTENPVVSGLGGVRFNPDGSRPFSGVATLSWPVDLGGKRGTRKDAAKADHRAATATADWEERQVLLEALLRHALILKDEQRLALAVERHVLSTRVAAAAQRRNAAGGVPELDVVLARMQEKQDESSEATATGARESSKAALFALLGLSDNPAVEGSLVPADEAPSLAVLLARIEQRTDVRAATAALDAAQTNASHQRANRWPTVNVLAQYERDDRANIGLIGLAIPIPVLNANRLDVATSGAEVDAARARMAYSKAAAIGQLKELYARYQATQLALAALEPTAALAKRSVSLATRGYELGENDLASILLVRREAVEAQASLLEASFAHASAKIELLVNAGKTPQ